MWNYIFKILPFFKCNTICFNSKTFVTKKKKFNILLILTLNYRVNEDLSPMSMANRLINQNAEDDIETKNKEKNVQKFMVAQGDPSLFNVKSTKNIRKT